ncbi:MAG TPA: hypothetical protein VK988_00655 [Acidimicrobiales bacterium]|nr:hypothetical protein [Acidimicrobiales bacterium]
MPLQGFQLALERFRGGCQCGTGQSDLGIFDNRLRERALQPGNLCRDISELVTLDAHLLLTKSEEVLRHH